MQRQELVFAFFFFSFYNNSCMQWRGVSSLIQLLVSVLLYFVIFFGIAFILNMLLRTTWLMAFLYPVVVLLIINDVSVTAYFTSPISSVQAVFPIIGQITLVDWIILASGLAGAIVSGFVIKLLRRSGYQMF
jgi:hypothetical protein